MVHETKHPKLLLLTEVFPPKTGGSGRWFYEIYRRLPRATVRIAAGEDNKQAEFDQLHDLRLHRLPLSLATWGVANWQGLVGYGKALRQVRRLLRHEPVDQIHCGRCLPEGLLALALKLYARIPYLCYAHGEELHYAHHSRELRWLMQRVFAHCELVIANSRNTERILLDEWRLPKSRVRLLHPGVDTARFVPASPDPAWRQAMGWQDRPVVLTVGRLQKRKGHDVLIQALAAIRNQIPNILYAIAGDGEERPSLEQLAKDHGVEGHIQFLGSLADEQLIACYQQCDLFILPNRQVGSDIEGFGMVLLEAQACGKPVIAGASGGTAETMQTPATGLIADCTSPEAPAKLVAELLADPARRERMGQAARDWVVRQFDWTTLSRRAQAIFESLGRTTAKETIATLHEKEMIPPTVRVGDQHQTGIPILLPN